MIEALVLVGGGSIFLGLLSIVSVIMEPQIKLKRIMEIIGAIGVIGGFVYIGAGLNYGLIKTMVAGVLAFGLFSSLVAVVMKYIFKIDVLKE